MNEKNTTLSKKFQCNIQKKKITVHEDHQTPTIYIKTKKKLKNTKLQPIET
jgi:ribosomal protein L28